MGVKIPEIDRVRYEGLMEDILARLPSFSGEWNDYNPSDPGITILELLAWFADIDSYRFNLVTSRHKHAFLELAGIGPKPSKPASVILRFKPRKNRKIVPAGTKLSTEGIIFETVRELRVAGANIISILLIGYGENIEVKHPPFYPFGRHPRDGFGFIMKLKSQISGRVRLFFKVRDMGLVESGSKDLVWRYCTEESECDKPLSRWMEASLIYDATYGLRKSGFVELDLPEKTEKIALQLKDSGNYENLVLIENILPDSVEAVQIERVDRELGRSSGYVNQTFEIEDMFDISTLEVKVNSKTWKRVAALEKCYPEDEVFTFYGGTLFFGDGGYGKIPPKGVKIECSYLKNEGRKGNVPANRVWMFAGEKDDFVVENPFPAAGGEDEKSMKELFSAFTDSFGVPQRAVTAADHEELALKTPETAIARAVARVDKGRNHIFLTLIPDSEKRLPLPSDSTISKVEEYMEQRRLLTTKIILLKPRYIEIFVNLKARSKTFDTKRVASTMEERLELFLHPLYGGSEKEGWVDAKTLYISRLYMLFSDMDDLLRVDEMLVTARFPDGRIVRKKEGYIEAAKGEIFASGFHKVVVVGPKEARACGGVK